MKCQNCKEENIDSAKFCKSCGSSMGVAQFTHPTPMKRNSVFKKNKKVVALVLVLIIAGASWFGYDYYKKKKNLAQLEASKEEEKKKNLDLNYLEGISKEFYLSLSNKEQPKTEAQINEFIDTFESYNKKIKVASSYFNDYAKETLLNDDEKKKYFFSMVSLLKSPFVGTWAKDYRENEWNDLLQKYSEDSTSILNIGNEEKKQFTDKQLESLSEKLFLIAKDQYENSKILDIDIQNKEECLSYREPSVPCIIMVDGKNIGTIEYADIGEIMKKTFSDMGINGL